MLETITSHLKTNTPLSWSSPNWTELWTCCFQGIAVDSHTEHSGQENSSFRKNKNVRSNFNFCSWYFKVSPGFFQYLIMSALLYFVVLFSGRATHNLFMLVNRHLKQNTVIELTEKQLEKVTPKKTFINCKWNLNVLHTVGSLDSQRIQPPLTAWGRLFTGYRLVNGKELTASFYNNDLPVMLQSLLKTSLESSLRGA